MESTDGSQKPLKGNRLLSDQATNEDPQMHEIVEKQIQLGHNLCKDFLSTNFSHLEKAKVFFLVSQSITNLAKLVL